jgi:protein Tex
MSRKQRDTSAEPEAFDVVTELTRELGLPSAAVAAVVRLLGEGATVPFIARYRKEATGGLDEVAIREIEQRHAYLSELEVRRSKVIQEIDKQGKLEPALLARLRQATTKAELEDLYLPYKPRRRTRATIAVERGLAPLAELLWTQDGREPPERAAARFVDATRDLPDVAAALAGARDICAERLSEDATLRRQLREAYFRSATVRVTKKPSLAKQVTKFDTYADFEEPLAKLPPHRYLAIRRGESEEVLTVKLLLDLEPHRRSALARVPRRDRSPWQREVEAYVGDALERLLAPQIASDVRAELKQRSDQSAIDVFARNLRELLLAPRFGDQPVLGIDPGQRTGCKCAAIDGTGRLLEHGTIYLVQGDAALRQAQQTLLALCKKHRVRAVAVGNGTHGRETLSFVRDTLRAAPLTDVVSVSVNEAGASVYSASDAGREEFPELDLTVRGAISIARRLQDPLSELVKIEPKSIGVGQYQHDVPEAALTEKLDEVVESCVSSVGVELNTASARLLSRVAGIGPKLATGIVSHRDRHGAFASRRALLEVGGLGPKTFEQAAGFLRISGTRQPLDASAVHPERYGLVERMAKDLGAPLSSLIGNAALLAKIDLARYRSADVGDFTLRDILAELDKPGRDPRQSFEAPSFKDDVRQLADLKPGMQLEGVVTNVAAFGAFVDVGVHQDGLVHVSELADTFVKDPHAVVKVGERLQVRVLAVDLERRRISLSARTSSAPKRAS